MCRAPPQPCGDPGRDQRVASEFEEIIVSADLCHSENFGEHLRDSLFDGRDRRLVDLRLEHGRRESFDIRLARGGQRNRIEHQDRVGNHVAGEERRHRLDDLCGIHLGAGLWHYVGNEAIAEVIVGAYKSYSLRNARASGQCGLDFAEFDTEPTDLDLEVAAAHVLHRATVDPPDHITRAVQPLSGRPEQVRDKTTRCQCRLSQVSTSDLNTRHVQLTRDTNRNGLQAAVQDPRGHTPNRAADVHAVKRGQRITDVRRDRRLRRTVRIEESTHTAVREWHRPLGNERPRTGFATDDNHPQRVGPLGSTDARAAGVTNAWVTPSARKISANSAPPYTVVGAITIVDAAPNAINLREQKHRNSAMRNGASEHR
ncbi:hypothetical protein GCM10020255_064440 [Rhodococcus baikonurensis]